MTQVRYSACGERAWLSLASRVEIVDREITADAHRRSIFFNYRVGPWRPAQIFLELHITLNTVEANAGASTIWTIEVPHCSYLCVLNCERLYNARIGSKCVPDNKKEHMLKKRSRCRCRVLRGVCLLLRAHTSQPARCCQLRR